ncbi:MAG: tRNA threonylcarbamoyladenosine dehydratase [Bacteroides sp.]|nr:tRNA threonylcarbamoyladenosine dehydratase [Bacteroides sp.]
MKFSRVKRLVGSAAVERLANVRVAVFGLGGVGSWAAEALVRSGVGHITMVDADVVAESNINRQLPAMVSTVGRPKTEVMREHLLDINPEAKINAVCELYTAQTAEQFNLNEFDYVIDAIDSLSDKALLILNTTKSSARLFSSMGAAMKMDPARIAVDEFWNVKGCPLAAALRRKFKRTGLFPRRKFRCVFSDELVPNREEAMDATTIGDTAMNFGKVAYNGALCHITAIFGMTLASLVIRDATKNL